MKIKHVEGKDRGKIMLYAISTCVWCKKTKRLLDELGAAYDYIDVDTLSQEEKEQTKKEMQAWNPRLSYPTLIINSEAVVGYKEDKIRKLLEKD